MYKIYYWMFLFWYLQGLFFWGWECWFLISIEVFSIHSIFIHSCRDLLRVFRGILSSRTLRLASRTLRLASRIPKLSPMVFMNNLRVLMYISLSVSFTSSYYYGSFYSNCTYFISIVVLGKVKWVLLWSKVSQH